MNEFEQSLFTILYYIPAGKLTTYGRLSKAAGYPNHSRHVGKILARLPKDTKLPWFRVVNSQGQISLTGEAFLRQKTLLENEGISVSAEGKIQQFRTLLVE
ncbi:MGMT family protein [Psychromonas aquimarina]|uniref:MGMT family protein n=1 Tax=Psychromonas aquimarina TaxID=444919 RepID=UPI0003FF948F|nr:MGMT family protein [Psychromonas aquimarina]